MVFKLFLVVVVGVCLVIFASYVGAAYDGHHNHHDKVAIEQEH